MSHRETGKSRGDWGVTGRLGVIGRLESHRETGES